MNRTYEFNESERMHLLHALECIRYSGDRTYDARTARLEKKLME